MRGNEVVAGLALLAWAGAAFAAQPNPVTNGSFEEIGPNGIPVDWGFVGPAKISDDAHTGKHAVLLETPPGYEREVGLNRAGQQKSGTQGKLLSELKGGFVFWYKALRAEPSVQLLFVVIPMDASPIEGTGSPRTTFEIPSDEVGDGQWHRGALGYDFTANEKVKWIHVGGRMKGQGAFLLDDIEWVESVGAQPRVRSVRLIEPSEAVKGERIVDVIVENAGDKPLTDAEATLSLPAGLRCSSALTVPAPQLNSGMGGKVKWTVAGDFEPDAKIVATVKAGEKTVSGKLALAPRLVVEQLRARQFLLEPGQTTTLAVVVRNKGNAMGGAVTARLDLPPELKLAEGTPEGRVDSVPPGETGEFVWHVQAVKSTLGATARCVAQIPGGASVDVASEMVVVRGAGESPPTAETVATSMSEAGAIVAGPKARLWLPKTEFGYGVADLLVAQDRQWKRMGRMARLGRIVVQTAGGRTESASLYAERAKEENRQITLSRRWNDGDGTEWAFEWRIGANKRFPDLIGFEAKATPNGKAKLLCFEGPMLHVGEGDFGGDKDQALFPGLEWLVKGEQSSSDLDIAEGHEHQVRLVPHPHMVTVPLMALYRGGAAVGLLWDQTKPYCADHNRPSAVFASPNRFDGHDSALMGLFAPSMPDYVAMNERVAHAPLAIEAGAAVTISAHLYADGGARDVLSAVDRWFAYYGVPEPERLPHGKTYADEYSFSARGYLDSAWIPEERTWWTVKSPSKMRAKPVLSPAYLYDTLRCGELGSDAAISARCRERVELVERASGLIPKGEDMGFEFRGGVSALVEAAKAAAPAMQSMGPEGEWRFNDRFENQGIFKGKDYGLLGPPNAVEAGTCAKNAYTILRFARMADDPQAKAAGLKALDFMDRFSVPRAAQVWEVPVHVPDILASSDACDAYLEGYEITGERRYLDKAVYWARTGLPFLFAWDVPQFEFLRYASIPVFGATWFKGSWFGRAVQWNGNRFAWALLKLSRHDESYPWRRIAEGITRSCQWQQVVKPKEDAALWPDWTNTLDRSYCENLLFLPNRMLKQAYAITGLEPEPRTLRLARDGQTICVNACAQLSDGAWEGDSLRFAAAWQAPQAGFAGIANLAEPKSVLLDGRPMRRNEQPGAMEPGWHFDAARHALEIRIPGPGSYKVEATGAQFAQSQFPPEAPRGAGAADRAKAK